MRVCCRQTGHPKPLPRFSVPLLLEPLVLRGHYGYYGLTGNYRAMKRFVREAERIWQVSLNRRSQKSGMTRTRFFKLLLCLPLPQPTILNPYRGVPA